MAEPSETDPHVVLANETAEASEPRPEDGDQPADVAPPPSLSEAIEDA